LWPQKSPSGAPSSRLLAFTLTDLSAHHEKSRFSAAFSLGLRLLEDSFWLHERFVIDFSVFIQDNRKTV
jgi:hypothetical protein